MSDKKSAKDLKVNVLMDPPMGAPGGSFYMPGRLTGRMKPGPIAPSRQEVEIHLASGAVIWLPRHQVPELQEEESNQWEFEEVQASTY